MAKPEESPPSVFKNAVTRLDIENRITFPTSVWRNLEWFDGTNTIKVMADLIEAGRIRIHHYQDVKMGVDALRAKLAAGAGSDEEKAEALSVLEDRYREISLYKEGRVRLTEAMLVFLGVIPPDRLFVFVQSSPRHLEILSLSFREARIAKYRAFLTPDVTADK